MNITGDDRKLLDGRVQIVDVSNAPFSRPDLGSILAGLKYVIPNDYSIRGRA